MISPPTPRGARPPSRSAESHPLRGISALVAQPVIAGDDSYRDIDREIGRVLFDFDYRVIACRGIADALSIEMRSFDRSDTGAARENRRASRRRATAGRAARAVA